MAMSSASVGAAAPGKRKTDAQAAESSKKVKSEPNTVDSNSPLSAPTAPSLPSSLSSSSPPPSRPLSTLTSMPEDEDQLYSHYVEQLTTKSIVQEGARSCVLETAYPPFY